MLMAGRQPLLNPDEMETQLLLPPGPMVPAVDPPECLPQVIAGLIAMKAPFIDPTMQYRSNLQKLIDEKKSSKNAAAVSHLSAIGCALKLTLSGSFMASLPPVLHPCTTTDQETTALLILTFPLQLMQSLLLLLWIKVHVR